MRLCIAFWTRPFTIFDDPGLQRMKSKLTNRKRNRVSVHAGQVEFVKVNIGGWQWRDVYQWLLALRWSQFAALVAAAYIALNLFFATLYSLDRQSIAGSTG